MKAKTGTLLCFLLSVFRSLLSRRAELSRQARHDRAQLFCGFEIELVLALSTEVGLRKREPDGKGCPLIFFTLDIDAAAMLCDDLMYARQP